jgi:hypothetical protein
MKSKLYIHIGVQKTGSTLLQKILDDHKPELKKERIYYLGRYREIAREFRVITENDPKLNNILQKAIIKDLTDINNTGFATYVISNEKFAGNKMTGYNNTEVIARSLHEITEKLDLDVYIIVYIRRQDDFIESTYQQKIFSGDTYTFDEFLDLFDTTAFNWHSLLQSYAGIFGKEKILVRRYHKTFLPDIYSLPREFGQIIGSNFLKKYQSSRTENTGITRDVLEILRITNSFLAEEDMRDLRELLTLDNYKNAYQAYSFFKPEERMEFLSRYEKTNELVAREFFNDASGTLFPPPKNEPDFGEYPGLSKETAIKILTKSIQLQAGKVKRLETELKKNRNASIKNKIMRVIKSSPVLLTLFKKIFLAG